MIDADTLLHADPMQAPMAPGAMIAVVGPSGAGKDSLMAYAARAYAGDDRVVFARRVITRPADAGGEDHEGVDAATFDRLERDGAFCISWRAHGLAYGIPVAVLDDLAAGRVVVVNGSRSALPHFSAAVPGLKVALVTAQPEVLAERLAARGRETRAEIEARLARSPRPLPQDLSVIVFDNSGPLDRAGDAFVREIAEALPRIGSRTDRPNSI